MTKQNVKVVVTTYAGFSVTADDAVKNGQGTAAYGAIQTGTDITVNDGTNITYVPYKAVDHAVITLTQSTVDDPKDDTCPEEEETTPGGGDPVTP